MRHMAFLCSCGKIKYPPNQNKDVHDLRGYSIWLPASLTVFIKPDLTASVNAFIHKNIVELKLTKEPIENSLKDEAIFIYPHDSVTFFDPYA